MSHEEAAAAEDLQRAMAQVQPGTAVTVTVLRNGQQIELTVRPGAAR